MVRAFGGRVWVATAVTLWMAAACHDAQSPDPQAGLVPGLPDISLLGSITVCSSDLGSSLDPDGYTVTVDLIAQSKSMPTNGSVTFSDVPSGVATVSISGVASNCTVSGGNLRVITVPLGGSVSTSFAITCASTGPQTGDLTVSTSTTGSNLDADGYTVTLDGNSSRAIGTNGSVTFSGLPSGSHTVVLSGIAGDCSVRGGSSRPRQVSGPHAGPSAESACSSSGSCLHGRPPEDRAPPLSPGTTGSNLDADGY